jgi:hypothetical protein
MVENRWWNIPMPCGSCKREIEKVDVCGFGSGWGIPVRSAQGKKAQLDLLNYALFAIPCLHSLGEK